ncbi:hypothetical protein LCGC14_2507430, partial [marine sediment metagenome]
TPIIRIRKVNKIVYHSYSLFNDEGQRKFILLADLMESHFPTKKILYKVCMICDHKNQYYYGSPPKTCENPDCELPHLLSAAPVEIELHKLQHEYLNGGRDPKIIQTMYTTLLPYVRSILFKVVKHHFSPNILAEKVHDASIEVLQGYWNNPDFKVQKSYGGLIFWKVRQVCFQFVKEEKNFSSLNKQVMGKDGKSAEFIDMLNHNDYTSLFTQEEERNPEEIFMNENENNILNDVMTHLNSLQKALDKNYPEKEYFVFKTMVLIGVYHFVARNFSDCFGLEEKYCQSLLSDEYNIDSKKLNSIIQKFMAEIYKLLKNYDN